MFCYQKILEQVETKSMNTLYTQMNTVNTHCNNNDTSKFSISSGYNGNDSNGHEYRFSVSHKYNNQLNSKFNNKTNSSNKTSTINIDTNFELDLNQLVDDIEKDIDNNDDT